MLAQVLEIMDWTSAKDQLTLFDHQSIIRDSGTWEHWEQAVDKISKGDQKLE